jgi:uncharacterized protein YbjT (DUF2867 family)
VIFLTGAGGKTGRAILSALHRQGVPAKVLTHSEAAANAVRAIGDFEVIAGDLRTPSAFESQLSGVDTLYYICPNVTPDEVEIGKELLALAQRGQFKRFVYHSVLHPQIEDMPHHWQKLRMEETLFKSGIAFTILQPCAYMQNILGGWKSIRAGSYITPYRTSARISIVDLEDIGQAAANVLTQHGHENAIYELAGPQPLSQVEVASALSSALGMTVQAQEQPRETWRQNALAGGLDVQSVETLLKMFEYYDQYGLVGNPRVLETLLGRKPASFTDFVTRILETGEVH